MRWMLMLFVTLAGLSCAAENTSPAASKTTNLVEIKHPENWQGAQKPRPQQPAVAQAAPKSAANVSSSPVPPKDAQFTIYCQDFTGPSHVDNAARVKTELLANTNLRGWYLIHQEDHSSLFYGYYKQPNDPEATRDRTAIQGLTDKFGSRVFQSVVVVLLDAPDPVAPSEWNLANLRQGDDDTQHFWTIQIGAYKDSPQRKQAAVEAVRAARAQGIEAYFYHGEAVSSVCVGCWPQQAMRIEGLKNGAAQLGNPNPDGQLMVAPGMNIPKNIQRELRAKNVDVSNVQAVIVDPKLAEVKRQFPDHAVNGEMETVRDPRGERVVKPSPSLIVQIPVAGANGGIARLSNAGAAAAAANQPPPEALRPIMPEKPQAGGAGTGRLKSVGN